MALATAAALEFGYLDPVTRARTGPFPKQALAHRCPADILFFGGAAGPGKSEFLVVEGITTCLEYPEVEVALFRRKNTELEKSLIGRFRKLVPRDARGKPIARLNAQKLNAIFPNGSILWFCHCQHEKNVYDYQSAEWVLLGIDEGTHFTEFQLNYLGTRVRSARPGIRKRIIIPSNPGNVGHGVMKRRFVKPSPSSVQEILLRYDPVLDEWVPPPTPGAYGKTVRPLDVWRPWPEKDDPTPPADMMTRCFIPARMEDNPALALADPTYKARIYALGGSKAKQLAEGDWDANDSMIVGTAWLESHEVTAADVALVAQGVPPGRVIPWHVLPNEGWTPPATATIFGSVDYGYGAPWSFHLHAGLHGGHTRTFFEFYAPRVRDVHQASLIAWAIRFLMTGQAPEEPPDMTDDTRRLLATVRTTFGSGPRALMPKPSWIVMDPAMWNSRAEMGLAKSIAEVYEDHLGIPLGIPLMKGAAGRAARVSRPQRWLDALSVAPDGLPWWSVTTACPHLIRTVPEVPWDEDDPEVEDDDSENHAYEDVGRFFEARPHTPRVKVVDTTLAALDPISRAEAKVVAAIYDPATRQRPKALRGFGGVGR